MNNNDNIGWLFFGGYKNILPSMLTIYSCNPLKAIQYYIIIFTHYGCEWSFWTLLLWWLGYIVIYRGSSKMFCNELESIHTLYIQINDLLIEFVILLRIMLCTSDVEFNHVLCVNMKSYERFHSWTLVVHCWSIQKTPCVCSVPRGDCDYCIWIIDIRSIIISSVTVTLWMESVNP